MGSPPADHHAFGVRQGRGHGKVSGAQLHARPCASIPGLTASAPKETEPFRPSEADGVAQRRRQKPQRFGHDRPQSRGRGVLGLMTSIHPHGAHNSVTHPNSTATDKGAAMLRKPRSQETPFHFRRSRPTSGLRGRKRRCPGSRGPQLLEKGPEWAGKVPGPGQGVVL